LIFAENNSKMIQNFLRKNSDEDEEKESPMKENDHKEFEEEETKVFPIEEKSSSI